MNQNNNNLPINVPITVVSTILVVILGAVVYLYPEGSTKAADVIFHWILFNLDTLFLAFALAALGFLTFLMVSKYGQLQLGNEKPEFSKLVIFNMLFCASFGASALFWSFTEVLYYFNDPPFGIAARSALAVEYGFAYNFFHWGPSAWTFYAICAMPIIYSFYFRGRKEFRLSAVCSTLYNDKWPVGLTRLIDAIFIFACFGVCGISLGLSVPLISECTAAILGVPAGFGMSVTIVLVISAVFTLSSYVGLGKGMSKISNVNVGIYIAFLAFMFILANPVFVLEMVLTGMGLMVQEYVRMSTWTDAIDKGGFPQYWTVFYWAYWMTFGPMMGVFITRIFKGHKLKDAIWMNLVAGSAGCYVMHGIMQSYTMKQQLAGTVAAADMVAAGQGNLMIVEILKTTPLPSLALLAFVIVAILFMATTLDGTSFTLASVASSKLKKDNPSPLFRLYWCILLAIMPLILTLIKVELNTIKTIALIVATPLGILLAVLNVKTYLLMRSDYQNLDRKEMAALKCPEPAEEQG
ncbi:hypothetical protein C4J81_14415 [Deltaproteobacteria bacterium Smac51]|nr:hypothetical protein C4J81_14415 [Deltaproteobacteria bacterium Smac51]